MTQAYPLAWPDGWPRTPHHKQKAHSQFSTTFDKARRDLLDELRLLGAKGVVVSSWLPLRNDGQPRADVARKRIEDSGVAVYFTLNGRQMVMARDAYVNVHDNLRSIGLAIAALRGLERHGGGTMMERAFEGFAALPAPKTWKDTLGFKTGEAISAEMVAARYRELARKAHPDAGGSDAAMAELNAAKDQAMKEIGR